MLDTFWTSVVAFFKGQLFQDLPKVFLLIGLGMLLCLVLFFALGYVAPLWVAALSAGLLAGAAQPWLFKDLKYK